MTRAGNNLYEQVVAIASDYLGPAGQRFIDRQIQNLLHKHPTELTKTDLDTIIDWSRVALAVITDKREIISEFADRVAQLKKEHRA